LLKKAPRTGIQTFELCYEMLLEIGATILKAYDGPLATILFETKAPIDLEAPEFKERFEAVGNADTPVRALGNYSSGFVELIKKPKPGYYITIQKSLPRIGVDKVWADREWDGGSTIIFGILDTGLEDIYYVDPPYPNHPEGAWYFSGRVIEHWQAYPWGGAKNSHCRLCLSVMMKARHEYEGEVWQGGLPKARAYVAQVLDSQGYGTTGTVHEGFAWMATRNPPPMIVNCSLGGNTDPVLVADVKRLWELGIAVVAASGNNGVFPPPCNGRINCPANAEENIAAGATDGGYELPGNPEMAQTWVARNPRLDGSIQKHFLSAPGVRIQVELGEPAATGTSLAAPHGALVYGIAWYYLLRKHPDWTQQQIAERGRSIIEKTCMGLGYEKDPQYQNPDPNAPLFEQPHYCIQGFGRVDAHQAMIMAKESEDGPEPEKIEKVEFILDGQLIGTETKPKTDDIYELEYTVAKGIHVFRAIAYAKDLGSKESDPVTFEAIEESRIICQVVHPKEGDKLKAGVIPLQVEAKVVAA